MRTNYERDDEAFPQGAYRVKGWGNGIAFYVRGWETEHRFSDPELIEEDCAFCYGTGEETEGEDCPNCEGTGHTSYECIDEDGDDVRTGMVIVTMIGDDCRHVVDQDDLTPLDRADYCGECGQIGCQCDGYDRTKD